MVQLTRQLRSSLLKLANQICLEHGQKAGQKIMVAVTLASGRKRVTQKQAWAWLLKEHNRRTGVQVPKQEKKTAPVARVHKPKPSSADFYMSPEWRELRFYALRENDGCCELCGRSKRRHGIVLHVDHIKPRSKFPELELDGRNLQILCEDCNLGKGNRDDKDWRGPHPFVELAKLVALHIAIQNSRASGESAILVSVETLEALIDGYGKTPAKIT